MSDVAQAEVHAPPKRRKRRKMHRTAPKQQGPVKAPAEFAGMTELECCSACVADKCVISGIGLCLHPMKSGIQPELARDPQVMARYGRAKKVLAHRKIDLDKVS